MRCSHGGAERLLRAGVLLVQWPDRFPDHVFGPGIGERSAVVGRAGGRSSAPRSSARMQDGEPADRSSWTCRSSRLVAVMSGSGLNCSFCTTGEWRRLSADSVPVGGDVVRRTLRFLACTVPGDLATSVWCCPLSGGGLRRSSGCSGRAPRGPWWGEVSPARSSSRCSVERATRGNAGGGTASRWSSAW